MLCKRPWSPNGEQNALTELPRCGNIAEGEKFALMEKIAEYVGRNLRAVGIGKSYAQSIHQMVEKGIITESMPLKAAYTTFLLHMGKESSMFLNILKGKYIFDLTCTVNTKKDDVFKKHTGSFEYVHTEPCDDALFIGIKFRESVYDELKNTDVPDYLIPYKILVLETGLKITDFRFHQAIFSFKEQRPVQQTYAEFIEHLKSLSLPLSIVSDDLLYENTNNLLLYDCYIYLEESRQWPKDQDAIDCAKAAFYCQLYSKSKHRVMINKNYCVFKYKGFYFKVKILIKRDFNVKHKVLMGLHSVMRNKNGHFHRKVKMIKDMLGKLGFYPLVFDDFLVDCIGLIVGQNVIGDAKCIENFMDFDLANGLLDLDTMKYVSEPARDNRLRGLRVQWKGAVCVVPIPSAELVEELRLKLGPAGQGGLALFNEDLTPAMDTLIQPDFKDYSFVLSRTCVDSSFKEIVGSMGGSFDLGTPECKDFVGFKLSGESRSYYSPSDSVLMVKVRKGFDADLIANIFINETSLGYIKFNK